MGLTGAAGYPDGGDGGGKAFAVSIGRSGEETIMGDENPGALDVFVSARVRLDDPRAVQAQLADRAEEYFGQLHQSDHWFEVGPRGTGVLVRKQAYAPPCRISIHRARREAISREELHLQPLELGPGDVTLLPASFGELPVLRVVRRARELWLWENLRIGIDQVDVAGIFLSLEAVIDEDHSEEANRQRVREVLSELHLAEGPFEPYTYAELVQRENPPDEGPEMDAIRAQNRKALEARIAALNRLVEEGASDTPGGSE